MPSIRIATLNLLHSNSFLDKRYEMLSEELQTIKPDILHLQEVNLAGHEAYIHKISQYGFKTIHTGPSIVSLNGKDRTSCNMTLTNMPSDYEVLKSKGNHTVPLIPTLITYNSYKGKMIVTFNVHLAWGEAEHIRALQVKEIVEKAENIKSYDPQAIIVIAGDFNTEDDSDSILFLKGKRALENNSTLWVDAWSIDKSESKYFTSVPKGILSEETAKSAGIKDYSLIPNRRIDYIFVKGWAYGRDGYPSNFNIWADKMVEEISISDHFGVYADLVLFD